MYTYSRHSLFLQWYLVQYPILTALFFFSFSHLNCSSMLAYGTHWLVCWRLYLSSVCHISLILQLMRSLYLGSELIWNNSTRAPLFSYIWTICQDTIGSDPFCATILCFRRCRDQMCKICVCKYTCQYMLCIFLETSGSPFYEVSNVEVFTPPNKEPNSD